MFKKFSFWIVLVLIASIGSVEFIHWRALQELHESTARIHPLYRRQKVIDSLSLKLERYRRLSSNFRKLSNEELDEIKTKLKTSFSDGVSQLDQLDPTAEEKTNENHLKDQLDELLRLSAHFEPLLFTKDAYVKPEVLSAHEEILATLDQLEKSAERRLSTLRIDTSGSESESMALILAACGVIFVLMISMIIRGHFVYIRPLKKLFLYAADLRAGKPLPQNPPHFNGMYGEIQGTLNQLALGVETHMRDRHKFILDIVADLKGPLELLQQGKYLLGNSNQKPTEQQKAQASESIRRGLAIFSGSLDDLNDIVDINRLESRLEEKTVDLSETLSDVARTAVGSESNKKVVVTVPPIPVWMTIDHKRFERVMIHLISKVLETIPDGNGLNISVDHSTQGAFRGVEISIQEAERGRSGRLSSSGPEQDILKSLDQ